LPSGVHSYALLPIGYPMGRFGPVHRIALPMSSKKSMGLRYHPSVGMAHAYHGVTLR
jgi:hypothetical protein